VRLAALGVLGGLVALAVWGKLRFVSDVPRMAYAEPKEGGGSHDSPVSHHGPVSHNSQVSHAGGPVPPDGSR
jgi:hypothetical protein